MRIDLDFDDDTTDETYVAITPLSSSTLSAVHGSKDMRVQFKDVLGNEGDAVLDSIILDSIITQFEADPAGSATTPIWEDTTGGTVTLSGFVRHANEGTEAVQIDFDYRVTNFDSTFDTFPADYSFADPLQEASLICVEDDCSFFAFSEYPRPTKDDNDNSGTADEHIHDPIATLGVFASFTPTPDVVFGSVSATTGSDNLVVVQERETSINLNPLGDSFIGNKIAISGGTSTGVSPDTTGQSGLVDDVDGTGIPDKLIDVNIDSGTISDATSHNGLTFADNDGIVVDTNGIMHLKPSTFSGSSGDGATLFFPDNTGFIPANPAFVSLIIKNSGNKLFEIEVTDGAIPPDVFSPDLIIGSTTGSILVPLNAAAGISKIEIKGIFTDADPPVLLTGTETMDLTNIETRGAELELINSFDFSDPSVAASSPFNTKTFDVGFFFANGTATTTNENNIGISANFIDATDLDYLPSFNPGASLPTNKKEFSVYSSSLSGYSSTGSATVKNDFGKGIVSQLCEYDPGDTDANGIEDDDLDRDAVCDSWEGKHTGLGIPAGIPFDQFFVTYRVPLDIACPAATCPGISTTTANGNPVNLLDEEAILLGTQVSNDLTPDPNRRDYYLEIDGMKLHPADIKALNDVITLWADLSAPPASPHDAIAGVDYSMVTPGVNLHIFLNQGRMVASCIDLDSSGTCDPGEPLYSDNNNLGDVRQTSSRLLNTGSITVSTPPGTPGNTDRQLIVGGAFDIAAPLLAVGTVPDDGFTHKNEITLWRKPNTLFNDDFNMIKVENYGTRDVISPSLTKDVNSKAIPQLF